MISRKSLALMALLMASELPCQQEPSSRDVVARLTRATNALESARIELTQTKSFPQLSLTDPPEHAVLLWKRATEMRLRLEVSSPEKRILTVKDGEYVLFQPKIRQAIFGKVNEGKNQTTSSLSLLLGDVSQVDEDYRTTSLGGETLRDRTTHHLAFAAKSTRCLYKEIHLWIDTKTWLPVQQTLVEQNDAVTVIEIHRFESDIDLSETVFTQKLPANVERVRG